MLLQSMEKRLETQPVYKLDDKDPNQAWLKEKSAGAGAVTRQDPPADQTLIRSQLKTGAFA